MFKVKTFLLSWILCFFGVIVSFTGCHVFFKLCEWLHQMYGLYGVLLACGGGFATMAAVIWTTKDSRSKVIPP